MTYKYKTLNHFHPRIPAGVDHKDTASLDYARGTFPVLESPPSGARIVRYGIDTESPPEDRRSYVEELASLW